MKKAISVCSIFVLIISVCTSWALAFDASEVDGADVVINPLQMESLKLTMSQNSFNEEDIAKEILERIGISEAIISSIPDEKLLQIYDSRKVEKSEIYICLSEDGDVKEFSKTDFEKEFSKGIKEVAEKNYESTPTQNSWAKLATYAIQSNSDKTSYLYMAGCEWLTSPLVRMDDYIAIASTEGSIDPESALSLMSYAKVDYTTGTTTNVNVEKKYPDGIVSFGRLAYSSFNLLNNRTSSSNGQVTGVSYQSFAMLIMINAKQINASISLPFNVSSAYFHKTIKTITNVGVSAGTDGLSGNITIKPSICFSRISNSLQVIHNV